MDFAPRYKDEKILYLYMPNSLAIKIDPITGVQKTIRTDISVTKNATTASEDCWVGVASE